MSQEVYAAYIGIDWSDRKHDIYLYDCTTDKAEAFVIGAQPEAIQAWVEGLRKRYGTAQLAVCLEQKRGPLIYALCQYENLVLYPINPRTVANYRKAFQPSRAKSDPIDAQILVELLQKHGDKIPAWQPEHPAMRALRQWVESRRMLVQEKVRLTNRITAALKNYYPQVLECFEDKDTQVFCAFVEHYPELKAAQAATAQELTAFFSSPSSDSLECDYSSNSADRHIKPSLDGRCRDCRTDAVVNSSIDEPAQTFAGELSGTRCQDQDTVCGPTGCRVLFSFTWSRRASWPSLTGCLWS